MMAAQLLTALNIALNKDPRNRGLIVAVWWNILLLIGSLAALPFDRRIILGLNPWIKPIKFELSVIVFLVTIAALLHAVTRLRPRPHLQSLLAWGIGICMIAENSLICMQSLRGVRSHMNYATVFDATVFAIMGLVIALSTALAAVLLALYCFTRTDLPLPVLWGIRLGLIAFLAGSAEGVRMVILGAHTIGAADGLPGLPFVNWSKQYGDLRVAHFFALHALQIFPLAGLALTRTRLTPQLQTLAVLLFAAIYSTAVWMLFRQAMAGYPVLPA